MRIRKTRPRQPVQVRKMEKPRLIFICTGNRCRSQMAEGWMRYLAGDKVEVFSAGITPDSVHPHAIKVMREEGIDISHQASKHINKYSNIKFDYVITVCDNAKEKCPYFSGNAHRLHHNFTDPAKATGTEEEALKIYRKVRDELKDFCREFVDLQIYRSP